MRFLLLIRGAVKDDEDADAAVGGIVGGVVPADRAAGIWEIGSEGLG